MSPAAALNSPIFIAYVWIVLGALGIGSAVLCVIQFVFKKPLGSIWLTYRSWLIMAPLAVAVVFAGRIAVVVAVAFLSIAAFREFARVGGFYRDRLLMSVVYTAIASIAVASFTSCYNLFVVILVLTTTAVVLLPILRNRASGELSPISLAVLGFFLIGWMFGHLAFIANDANGYGCICFVVFAVEVTDIAGFTFGRLLGRHPLRSAISPGKTLEGAVGGCVVALGLPWLLRFSFPFFRWPELLVAGLIVGIGAPLGDLTISFFKRELGAKDMGRAIPGHGGILDRIDSLIYVAPLFMHMTKQYHG